MIHELYLNKAITRKMASVQIISNGGPFLLPSPPPVCPPFIPWSVEAGRAPGGAQLPEDAS